MHRSASCTVAALLGFLVVACASAPEASKPPHASSTTSTGSSGVGGSTGSGGVGGEAGAGGAGGAGSASDAGHDDGGDAQSPGTGGGSSEAGTGTACSVDGAPGQCVMVSACAALTGYTSTPGHCPGPADIECCMPTPNVADDPPTPAGYQIMTQAEVTAAMTTWAVMILDDPKDYPLFSTTTQTFGALLVLALVEWHPPDFQNGVVHRGVTLYQHL